MFNVPCLPARLVFTVALIFPVASGLANLPAAAAEPLHLMFDLPFAIECRDVTPGDFRTRHPDRKIVEVCLPLSVRIEGDLKRVREIHVEIKDPKRRLTVHGFAPETTLESVYAEPITISKTKDVTRARGASLGVGVGLPAGHVALKPGPSVSAEKTGREVLSETSKKIPPKQPVVVSGTLQNRSGIFVEYKPSPQRTFEGTKEIRIEYVVPKDWQGDWLAVRFRTRYTQSSYFQDRLQEEAAPEVAVGLYLAESADGHQLAEQLAVLQRRVLNRSAEPRKNVLFARARRWLGVEDDDQPAEAPTAADRLQAAKQKLSRFARF